MLLAGSWIAASAAADDVLLELGPGDDFVVEDDANNELLRVDEEAGKLRSDRLVVAPPGTFTGQGALASAIITRSNVSAAVCTGASAPYSCCTGAGTGTCNWSTPLLISGDDVFKTPLICWTANKADTPDQQVSCIAEGGQIHFNTSIAVDGDGKWRLDSNLLPVRSVAFGTRFPSNMVSIRSDVRGALAIALNDGTISGKYGVWIEDDDEATALVTGRNGELVFCDTTDLAAGLTTDYAGTVMTASAGMPYAGFAPGDLVALNSRCGGAVACSTTWTLNAGLYQVASVGGGGSSLTMTETFSATESATETEVYRCSDWLITGGDGAIELGANSVLDGSTGSALRIPNGADCPATCSLGDVFMDTDTSSDSSCTSSFDGAVCGCYAADSWGCP